jgi:hypothetical protein
MWCKIKVKNAWLEETDFLRFFGANKLKTDNDFINLQNNQLLALVINRILPKWVRNRDARELKAPPLEQRIPIPIHNGCHL